MAKTKGRTLTRLVVPISIKAVTDTNGIHTFEGLASTWQQDLGNDVIKRGAFKNSLSEIKKSPDALPLLNSHNGYDIFASIGQMLDAQETKDGLWTKWALLPGAEGDRVYSRIQPHPMTGKSTVGKMSIGYEPVKFSYEQPEGTTSYFDQIRHLEEVKLREVSLVLFPMNPGASVDASTVKQFMHELKEADPESLDKLTRHQLRQLSGRIGNLLKKHKQSEDEDEDKEDGKGKTKIVVPTQVSSKSTPAPSEETPQDEDDEELEIAAELLDEEEREAKAERRKNRTPATKDDDDDDDETDDSSEESEESEESHESDADKSSEKKDEEKSDEEARPGQYMFAEALNHRINKLKLKRIINRTEPKDDDE